MENQTVSGTKKPLFGGRRPLFTQKELLLLTGPLLVEQLLEVTVGMADTMMVSRCGEAAISGVSLVDMINNLIIVLFAALATGGAVVVSQFLGAREQKGANESSGQLILLSGLFGLLVGAFCFVLARPMIRLFYGAIDADVLDASVLYLRIIAISYPFLALYNGGAALFRSMGNSKISMQISFLMNVINIVGNAVCIFGLKMGVDGVAWPSVVSRVVAAFLILRRCYQKGNALTVPKTTRLDARMTRRILGIGIPSAFENSLFEAGRILVVSMISTFGTVQIAANAVANNLDGMGVIPGKALSLAMITVVGRCVGAGDSEQAVYYTRKLSLWSYIAMGLSNGAILLFLHKLIGIYALSGETMVLSETLVRIHAGFAILLWTLSFVLPNALRAANDVKFTMLVSILSMPCGGLASAICSACGWAGVPWAYGSPWSSTGCAVSPALSSASAAVYGRTNITHNIKEYSMKLISWNVNGLRACLTHGFAESFAQLDADIFSVQETKMQPGQADFAPEGYTEYTYSAEKKGYSGTACWCREQPLAVTTGIGIEEHDHEGRVLTLEYPAFWLVNCYTPNSQDGLKRLDYRMEWENAFRAYLLALDAKKPVILCGDLNVAHTEIDIKNAKTNRMSAGFTDQERGKMTELLDAGFADSFRVLHPDEVKYSWWSYRFHAREKNAGWRIDYFIVSRRIADRIRAAEIHNEIFGSDHCPVELDIDL